jgi:hypothetical protein
MDISKVIRIACGVATVGTAVVLVGCGSSGKSDTIKTTSLNRHAFGDASSARSDDDQGDDRSDGGHAVDGGKFGNDDSEDADDKRGDGAKSSDDESEDSGHAAIDGGMHCGDDDESHCDGGISRVDGGRSDESN